MKKKRHAIVSNQCVACGSCVKVCPFQAINVYRGMYAYADPAVCVGCGICKKECPAGVITIVEEELG